MSDVQREVDKAEADVQLVRDRAARDQARLDAGTGSAKDLQAIQHELTSLARRQSELEDIQLEVMEHIEVMTMHLSHLETSRAEVEERLRVATQERDEALGALEAEREQVAGRREGAEALVGGDLTALYERIRGSSGGVGAAQLSQRRCGGCHMELNQVEMNRIAGAAADEVLRCDECGRILVRTGESGLPAS